MVCFCHAFRPSNIQLLGICRFTDPRYRRFFANSKDDVDLRTYIAIDAGLFAYFFRESQSLESFTLVPVGFASSNNGKGQPGNSFMKRLRSLCNAKQLICGPEITVLS